MVDVADGEEADPTGADPDGDSKEGILTMLSIPTLAQILTSIGATLLVTAILVAALATWTTRLGSERPFTGRRRPIADQPLIAALPGQRTRAEHAGANH